MSESSSVQEVASAVEPVAAPISARRALRVQWTVAWALMTAVLIGGWFLCDFLDSVGLTSPHIGTGNVVFYLFGAYDQMLLLPLAVICLILLAIGLRRADGGAVMEFDRVPALFVPIVVAVTLLVTAVGTYWICQDFALPMDEYFARLQAEWFRSGHINGHIDRDWQPYGLAMTSPLLGYDAAAHTWMIPYHPVYSGIRWLFGFIGLESLTNALLSAASIWFIALAAARLWPNERKPKVLAVIFLATSAQFLVYGMSSYSMQAHLCLNLAWFVLFFSPRLAGRALAPWVGVLALGLHQPNIHALFVAPFLFRLLLHRQWSKALYNAAVYILGLAIWYYWFTLRVPVASTAANGNGISIFAPLTRMFSMPSTLQWTQQLIGADFLIGWNSLLLLALFGVALMQFRRLESRLFDLAAGAVLAGVFYLIFSPGQGHGWGQRYLHPYLGSVVLLAVAAYRAIEKDHALLARPLLHVMAISTAVALIVQIPFRLWQVREFTLPFATASAYLNSLPADVVIFKARGNWYAQDLIRNSPDGAARPKIMSLEGLTRENGQELLKHYNVRVVEPAELARLGLFEIQPRKHGTP